MNVLHAIFGTIGTVLGFVGSMIAGILGLVAYVLFAIGLMKMAKNAGIKHGWLAWIPFVNFYLIGELIGNEVLGIKEAKWILVLAPAVIYLINLIFDSSFLFGFLTAVYYLYRVCAYYKLYKIYSPGNAFLFTLLGLFIPFLNGIFVFISRDNPRSMVR